MFQVTTFDARTLLWWHSKKKDIDFTPVYQRPGERWSRTDQAFLIDSIINGFDIPKFYLADFTFYNTRLNTANKPYAVIDGKQRLNSIFSFIDNELHLNNNFIYYKNKSINLSGLYYKDLKNKYIEIASDFDNFNIAVMRVITDEVGMIEQLFSRLNKGQPLTGPEKRNVMSGPVVELIRNIARHKFFTEIAKFPKKKGEDYNLAAKIIYLDTVREFTDTKRTDLDRFTGDWDKYNFQKDMAEERISRVLDRFCRIFCAKEFLTKAQGDIPIYYLLVANRSEISDEIFSKFFVFFDALRKNPHSFNIKNESIASTVIDDCNLYNVKRRNTNDGGSIKDRYNILSKYIDFYKEVMGVDV